MLLPRKNGALLPAGLARPAVICLLWFLGNGTDLSTTSLNAQTVTPSPAPTSTRASAAGAKTAGYHVAAYVVAGAPQISTNDLNRVVAKYTGPDVSLEDIVKAAYDLQREYRNRGYPNTSVAIAREQITNGVVTLNVFPTVIPQIVISGVRCPLPTNGAEISLPPSVVEAAPPLAGHPAIRVATNASPRVTRPPLAPATPEEFVRARAALSQKMAELDAQAKDTRIHVVSTNAGPRFDVEKYLVAGNTVLAPSAIWMALTNIDGAFGTNVSFDGIRTAVQQLQLAYRDRGYVTVAVDLPQQKLTNATVKVEVLEGRLSAINVAGNRYFSSNNVIRALPGLHTNLLLNAPIFQAELNRANANQDRQIYPVMGPGPVPGTSALTLNVKDRPPFHAKLEFNNQNSPGTPDMRLNASAVEDNLWQREHSLGIQYGFSPEATKVGNQWDFYDEPAVAYYSGFYRLPLGNPEPIEDVVANNPGSFGYSEATRQFRLPPPSGQSELNLYASRATIDPGIEVLSRQTLFDTPFVRQLFEETDQQGLTINQDVGFQLSKPLPQINSLRSTVSGGLDFKTYSQVNYKTNIFTFIEYTKNSLQLPITRVNYDYIPTPTTDQNLEYLPLSLNLAASLNNFVGPATLGLGLSANLWYDSYTDYSDASTNHPDLHGLNSLQGITGSTESSGHWLILRPSYTQTLTIHSNWVTTLRADGQWASEPLISSEQFGIGGVNSVRGYHEGEVFGDTGWHVSLEQDTPQQVLGRIYGNQLLTLRESVYMDWATAYLLDPQGRPGAVELWGTGFGLAASVGSHWQARFLFSLPLTSTSITSSGQPFFNFSLMGQF